MSDGTNQTLFVGIGSPHGDDQIGWRVADALVADAVDRCSVRRASVPTSLLDWLDGIDRLAICDASRGGGPVGTCSQFEWNRDNGDGPVLPALARLRTSGSHAFGLSAVLELAQRLGRLPRRIVVWAIEGRAFQPGDELSAELVRNIPMIAATIRSELSRA